MAVYLLVAGATPAESGLTETVDGLVVDWTQMPDNGYVTTIGDNAASNFVVTHNFGTRDVDVVVIRAVSPYDQIDVDVERTSTNTVTVKFAGIPAINEYRVVVQP